MGWFETISEIEPFDDLDLDRDIVEMLERENVNQDKPIAFYTPTFKEYTTSEIKGCGKNSFPAFSITGGACALNCDHCQKKILDPMIAATSPEELEQKVRDLVMLQDLRGFLLSGGSNKANEIPYERYYPTIEKLKTEFPHLKIACHSALIDEERAKGMESAGVDVAMIDVIGSQDTVKEVYHLDRPVEDFEKSLAALCATKMEVVPHIVIGLHYGEVRGEYQALEWIAKHNPAALVLVVVMPFYAPETKPFKTVCHADIAKVFVESRKAMPATTPVQLGCARPAGSHKMLTDAYAVMAGLDGIAYPAEGVLALTQAIGRPDQQHHACCSMALDGDGSIKAPCAA